MIYKKQIPAPIRWAKYISRVYLVFIRFLSHSSPNPWDFRHAQTNGSTFCYKIKSRVLGS